MAKEETGFLQISVFSPNHHKIFLVTDNLRDILLCEEKKVHHHH